MRVSSAFLLREENFVCLNSWVKEISSMYNIYIKDKEFYTFLKYI